MTENANIGRKCGKCGAPLAADAPEGLCPRCLMALNLATQTEAPGAESGPGGTQVVRPKPEPPLPLEEIARHFPQLEVLECLGRGGMGVVYKARQPRLDRFVALKILAPEKEKDPRFAERFTREAQSLARLNHPNIVTVYDFGEADGLYYLLMEFVDGMSLRRLLQTRKLAPEEALTIVPSICEALQYAHQLGIVHRDIKPENILLDKQGRVKIADYGIAKLMGGAGQSLTPALSSSDGERVSGSTGEGTLTQDQVIGTPNYMAPEQVEKPGIVDHRADIYSLGVVFYEMLTGELPLGKFAPPSRIVKVDVRLDEVVLHALEKEPARRYQQASQVKTDVETIATTSGRPAAPSPTAAPPEVNGWQPAILLVAALLCGALLLAGTVLPRPLSWILFLFGSFGLIIAGLKLAGLWPFPSPVFPRSNFTRRNLGKTPPATPPGVSPSWDIVRQVKGPAIGLIVTAILNWVAIPFVLLITALIVGDTRLLSPLLVLVPLSALVLSGIMLVAGLKMKRLQGYGLAVAGSILAILVTPGNLIGLPIGIWALVVLSQRQVREAFGKGLPMPQREPGQPGHSGAAWSVAAVFAAAVLVILAVSVGGMLCAIAIPNFVKARNRAKQLQQQVAQAPNIVATSPAVGATEVDPGLKEITVTFDQEMAGGFSWTGSGPDYPLLPEGQKPQWRDKRTCVLPVKLEAGHYYRVGINSTSYQNFRSAAGVPAKPSAIYFTTQGADEALKARTKLPQIIEFSPPNGAQDVDPGLKELRVTFNVPMGGGFSWCGGGPHFPKGREGESPYWTNGSTTCVLPVKLDPSAAYELWLNSESYKNFQSAGGVPLEPVAYTFKTSGKAAETASAGNNSEEQQHLKMAEGGNKWAAFWLWDSYYRGHNGIKPDPAKADKWLGEFVRNVWEVKFEPVDDFTPASPEEFLARVNHYAHSSSGETDLGTGSFFRTTKQGGKLVGSFLCNYPDELKAGLAKVPGVKVTSVKEITPDQFIKYEQSPQESL